MKTLTRTQFQIPLFFVLTLMLFGAFSSPVIAAEQSRPDLVLRIHSLVPALKVVDDIAGAAGSQISPSLLLGGMLQGTAWIDASKDVVFGAWFDPAMPDAQPAMGALVPYTYENSGFSAAYHAETRKGYYLVPLPPGNPTPLTAAFESALVGESTTTSGRFLSMEISLSQILKNADSRVEKWTTELEQKMPAAQPGSPPSMKPDQARKMVAGLVELGKQVKRLAVGIDLNAAEASFFMAIKGDEGSKLNALLTAQNVPGQSRLINLVLPDKFSIRFSTRRYSNAAFTELLNDTLGEFYRSIGIDLSETGTVMKYFTGETAGGMTLKNGNGFDLAIAAVLDDSVRQNPDFLKSIYIPWLIDYSKKITDASRDINPGASYTPRLSRSDPSEVSGQQVLGVTGLFSVTAAPGEPAKTISVSIRMALMDGFLLAASDDRVLGKLIDAAGNLKPGPATGPFFEARMRPSGLTASGTEDDSGASLSGDVIITADIRDGELVIEDKMRVDDIKKIAAAAMKAQKQLTPAIETQAQTQPVTKRTPPEKKKELTSDTPGYWINKGSLYSSYGNETAAIRSFKKALELDPKAVEADFKLGVSYGALREYDMALTHVNRALDTSPDNSRYRYGRAWIYLLSGRKDKAMDDMKAAAEMGNPDAIDYLKRYSERVQ